MCKKYTNFKGYPELKDFKKEWYEVSSVKSCMRFRVSRRYFWNFGKLKKVSIAVAMGVFF